MGIFNFFKRIDEKYEEPEVYAGHVPPKPIPQPKPTDWKVVNWNSEAFVASATTTVEQSTQLNEGNAHMNYIALVSTLISTIKAVEALLPNSTGKEKLDLVVATVEGIFGEVTSILPQLTSLIAVIVTGFNKLGVFTKKAVAA